MFCPQCATENNPNQSYCRQCGQPLAALQLALEGRVMEATAKFRKAEEAVSSGLVILGIFTLIAVVALLIGGFPAFGINIALGLIISLPLFVKAVIRLRRINRLLNADGQSDDLILEEPSRLVSLPAAQTAAALDSKVHISSSITEHTTRNLKTSEPKL